MSIPPLTVSATHPGLGDPHRNGDGSAVAAVGPRPIAEAAEGSSAAGDGDDGAHGRDGGCGAEGSGGGDGRNGTSSPRAPAPALLAGTPALSEPAVSREDFALVGPRAPTPVIVAYLATRRRAYSLSPALWTLLVSGLLLNPNCPTPPPPAPPLNRAAPPAAGLHCQPLPLASRRRIIPPSPIMTLLLLLLLPPTPIPPLPTLMMHLPPKLMRQQWQQGRLMPSHCWDARHPATSWHSARPAAPSSPRQHPILLLLLLPPLPA